MTNESAVRVGPRAGERSTGAAAGDGTGVDEWTRCVVDDLALQGA